MKANYGVDAPGVVTIFAVAGLSCIALRYVPGIPAPWPIVLLCVGGSWILTAAIMVFGSKFLKLRLRDQLLDSLHLKGDERVLDIGCGRGLLLIGLAKRLPNGKAFGIDMWNTADQSGNTPKSTLRNAKIEKVEDRIVIETADMRRMPFEHQSFDCVVSSWAIHNIQGEEGRWAAVLEAVRVLKPGGQMLIVDIMAADNYAELLRGLKMEDVSVSPPNFLFLIPSKIVRAVKPIKVPVDKNLMLS